MRPDLLPRGVHRAPYLDRDGHPILFAVDSRGRRIAEISIEPGEDPRAVAAVLYRLLDQEDPPS
jgi:hypothetical protein